MTRPGNEPMARSDAEEPILPDWAPHRLEPPKPLVKLSLRGIEGAENIIDPKPDGEAESETEFAKTFQEAIRKANPGNETLRAMEK